MRVFITGASGWVGSAVVKELVSGGHTVLGLARTDDAVQKLAALGAESLRGGLDDLDSLKRGAADCDGVIHLAFVHNFTDFAASCATDRRTIETIGAVLAGTGRPFVVTCGAAAHPVGRAGTEDDAASIDSPLAVRGLSETAALALAEQGVRVSVVRLPPSVHGKGDKGFVPRLVEAAREKGFSTYVGEGNNRWPAVHVLDAAHLYCLALEKGVAGSRYHAMADEGLRFRDIAEAIGRGVGVPAVSKTPEEARALLGFIGMVACFDRPQSSALTQQRLGWRPTQPGLIADIEQGHYFDPTNTSQVKY